MTLRLAAAASAAMVLAACADRPALEGCTCDADCGEGSACFSGACVANGAPSGAFEPPVGATTHRLIRFTATTRDPEGDPVTARWSFRPVAGGCDAEPEPAGDDSIDAVFWCAGRYEATLVPVDARGLEGEAVVRAFDVAASVGAPSVVAGPAVPAAHRCDPSVPRCAVLSAGGEEALPLEAPAADPDGETLHFEWRALPPSTSEGDPTLRVTFLPDSFAPAPIVSVENGGGPIAGTWRFRVRAVDPGGLIGEAHVTVDVANAAPYAGPTAASLPHRHEGGAFLAEGEAPVGVVDPDGDAVTLSASLSDPPPSCSQSLEPAEGGYRLAISCTDPADLIGPARDLRIVATDVHGAALQFEIPVTIENRPPTFAVPGSSGPGGFLLDHAVGPCTVAAGASCFFAEGSDPFLVADPDGDPVSGYALSVVVAEDRPSARAAVRLEGGLRRFRLEAPVTHPLDFRSTDDSTGFALAALAHDPWVASPTTLLPVRIGNRSPIRIESPPLTAVSHTYDPELLRYQATAPGPRFVDPDGDPLAATASTTGPCGAVALAADGRTLLQCKRAWDWRSLAPPPLLLFAITTSALVTVRDGWTSTSSIARVSIADRPPSLVPSGSAVGCTCGASPACPLSNEALVRFTVPVEYLDPDGDPALVTATESSELQLLVPPVACLPGSCAVAIYAPYSALAFGALDPVVALTLTADTGRGATPPATFTVMLDVLGAAPACE